MKFELTYSAAYGYIMYARLNGLRHTMDSVNVQGYLRSVGRLLALDRDCERCGAAVGCKILTLDETMLRRNKQEKVLLTAHMCDAPEQCYRIAIKVTFPVREEVLYFVS